MAVTVVALVVSMAVILAAAELFTNGVEWLGKKLNLGEGAVGSILAAVGTAMPETLIPMVAILLGGTAASHEIGIGAILGAPFMLSTAAFFVTGTAIFIFAAEGRRTTWMRVNPIILERDIRFFLIVYAFAVLASFIRDTALGPVVIAEHTLKLGVAALLVGLYGYYVWRTLNEESTLGEEELAPLRFAAWLSRINGSQPTAAPALPAGGGHASNPAGHAEPLAGGPQPGLAIVVLQVLVALGMIIGGAKFFTASMEEVAHGLGIPALVLALILAPLATELPEKFNSVIWVRNWKDTLALGNITGAMVFQSCIPVAVGLVLTDWELDTPALVSAVSALGSATLVWALLRIRKALSPHVLVLGGIMYALFIVYVVVGLAGAGAAVPAAH
jgi:cation:H+ antiporter